MTIEPNGYKALKNENKRLIKKNNKCIKTMIDLYNEKVELIDENKKLQQKIDSFYYQQSKLKETDFYIKALKNQLFNAYLKQQQQERLISELKEALSSYNNFVDEMFPN